MPYAEDAFSTLGETIALEGRSICAADIKDADLLATRSTTKVNAALLEGSTVRFVGTATIGTDHLDIDYLESRGIHWCFSPGCNANSVSEYVTAALLCLADRHGFSLRGKTIGIIGVGNVGRKVVEKAEALGMNVLQNDPPRQRTEPDNDSFCDLNTLLTNSDIVTIHVPITKSGPDKTMHLADASFFSRMKPGSIFINAARGAVVNSDDLLEAIRSGHIARTVLDTWEGEPAFRRDLLQAVDIGTPHIAGHSFEGKVAGTVMVYQAACRFLGIEPTWSPDALLPPPLVPQATITAGSKPGERVLWEVVKQLYDIESDDARLRAETDDRTALFDSLRKNYPIRREFRFTSVTINNTSTQLQNTFERLGFRKG
jgi:erythronate-4-phosphate dehydrogenase